MSDYQKGKAYIVTWINLYDNELYQQQVIALNEFHALQESEQSIFEPNEFHTITSMVALKYTARDREFLFSVFEINPNLMPE